MTGSCSLDPDVGVSYSAHMKGYSLTPLGPNWSWGERLFEIAIQTIGIVVVRPVYAVASRILFQHHYGRYMDKRRRQRAQADEIEYRQSWP